MLSLSPDGRIEAPMRPPGIHRNRSSLTGECCIKQNISQPCRIAALKVEGVAEYSSLVPTTRMRRAHAVLFDLADIEDSFIAVRQARRHAGARILCLMAFSEYINVSCSNEPLHLHCRRFAPETPPLTQPSAGHP
jgi:hypothetical protein